MWWLDRDGEGTGGSQGGREAPPEINFGRIIGKLVRYFRQSPDYWLDHATLQDWRDIYSRELMESPPLEELAAAYLGYKPPERASADAKTDEESDVWECPYPNETE